MKCNDEWHVFVDGDAKCQCGAGERKIIDAQPPVSRPEARLVNALEVLIAEWRARAYTSDHIDFEVCADELAGVLVREAGKP